MEKAHTMKRIHQYHSTKVFRVRFEPSALCGIALLGIAFVVGMYFSH
jgi:hypothetical protein